LTGLRPEGCGRLSAAGYVRFAQGAGRKVLKMDRPAARGSHDGLSGRGLWIALRAMLIKSALRINLSASYGKITILLTGSLRSPSPIRLRRTSPYAGGRIKHLEASLRKRLYSKHGLLCHLEEGERWWRQLPKGDCISNARRAIVWFSHGRKPGCKGFIIKGRLQ